MSQDIANDYSNYIEQFEILSGEEQTELCLRAQNGDTEARDTLIKHNLRLVLPVAREYSARANSLGFMDLVEEGNIGLMRAVSKFVPEKGTKFSTYAYKWIRQGISRAVFYDGKFGKLPVYMSVLLSEISSAVCREEAKLGRKLTAEEIEIIEKEKCQNPRRHKAYKELMSASQGIISFDAKTTVKNDSCEDGKTFGETIAHGDDMVDKVTSALLREEMEKLIDQEFNEKEAYIIKQRFGFLDGEEKTCSEIGAELGISKETVRQIEVRCIRHLREPRFRYLKECV